MKAIFAPVLLAVLIAGASAPGQPQRLGRPTPERPAGVPGRPPADTPGPWDHDVQVYRVSTGGTVTRVTTFERAGVPSMARLNDGRLLAAHQHFPADSDTDFDKVAVRFSLDDGQTWTAPQVIRLTGLPDGMRFPFDPTLVPLPDGSVRLYFTSLRGQRFEQDLPAIYSAISNNGLDYAFEPGRRFGIEGRPVIDCAVVFHQGTFHLYAPDNGPQRSPQGTRDSIPTRAREGVGYHATSQDGLRFTHVDDVRIEGGRRWLGNAQSDGQTITFLGTGDAAEAAPRNSGAPRGGVWMAASQDGQTWRLLPTPNIPGADPGGVASREGGWIVAATGPPRPGSASDRSRRPGPPFTPDEELGPEERRAGRPSAWLLTFVPSTAGGKRGIAVGLLPPREPRYAAGAPVVIHVPGGVDRGATEGRPEYAGLGFVEIRFAFPGGGHGAGASGGTYDQRGPHCVRALADVIGFATGRLADQQRRKIGDLLARTTVLTQNVGVVGSSHGGNACGLAMATHGEEFPDLAFYASMESPYGEGNVNIELGGRDQGVNPAYDAGTGRLDLSRLAWSNDLAPGPPRRWQGADSPLRGSLFFDLNGDGRFVAAEDFPANVFVQDLGQGPKAWYTPRLVREAEARGLWGERRPAHMPSLAESLEYWRWRDAAGSISNAARKCTNLAVIVYANERDHVQVAPDHPHILAQVEGFRQAGAKFVRLNADRAYVERALADGGPAGRTRARGFPDNDAGVVWLRRNIREGLEPEAFPIGLYMRAAVAELADRVQAQDWSKNLNAVLFSDVPGRVFEPSP